MAALAQDTTAFRRVLIVLRAAGFYYLDGVGVGVSGGGTTGLCVGVGVSGGGTTGLCVGVGVSGGGTTGLCVGGGVGVSGGGTTVLCVGVAVCVGLTVGVCVGVTVTLTVVVLLELHPVMAAAVTAAAVIIV